jgi:hypothetical protein
MHLGAYFINKFGNLDLGIRPIIKLNTLVKEAVVLNLQDFPKKAFQSWETGMTGLLHLNSV